MVSHRTTLEDLLNQPAPSRSTPSRTWPGRHRGARPRASLKLLLTRAVVVPTAFVIGFALSYVAIDQFEVQVSALAGVGAATDAQLVDVLRAHRTCWDPGTEPPGTHVPATAIVTMPGQRPQLADAAVGVGIFFDERPGVVHAYCA